MNMTGQERITYPRMTPTSGNPDPCSTPSMSYYHLLNCGHIITTPTPNERCGKTCRHVVLSCGTSTANTEAYSLTAFHCQACDEENIEANMLRDRRSVVRQSSASAHRLALKQEYEREAEQKRERKSYISAKAVSVPCNPWNGMPMLGYVPTPGHPFDTANPPAGTNMFEDIPQAIPQEEVETQQVLERPTGPWSNGNPHTEEEGEEGEELMVEMIVGDRDRLGERIYHVRYHGIEEGGDWLTVDQLNKYEGVMSTYQEKIQGQYREADFTRYESINPPIQLEKTPENQLEHSQGLSTLDSRPFASRLEIMDSQDAQGMSLIQNRKGAGTVRKEKKLVKIVGHHVIKTRGFQAYRVKWVGSETEEWVSKKELTCYLRMVEDYHRGKPD